jgi:hypothetical protein
VVVVVLFFVVVVLFVVVVDVFGNNDGSTLCIQLYEIDLAKPTRLFCMSKIE